MSNELKVQVKYGTLVAKEYRECGGGIEIELRKPDGTVGTVVIVECDGPDAPPFTPVHTFVFDGRESSPEGRNCDIDGPEFQYRQ